MKIQFLNDKNLTDLRPVLAKDSLPDWYKETQPYINNNKASALVNGTFVSTATVKKCMPVFDVMTAGYLIAAWADIKIYNENGVIYYDIDSQILGSHSTSQVGNHFAINKDDDLVAKFINTWAIKTPEGYSCLFIPPAHRPNVISIMPAVVDTDSYNLAVHFPFVLADRGFVGVIPKGTPLVQVIPFKRDDWEMECFDANPEEQNATLNRLHSMDFNSYKEQFRTPKSYN
jgi:hypothetical protein